MKAEPAQPEFTGTRESLHARISDVLRRSGVEDAEQLIRAMEVDAAEVVRCLKIGRANSENLYMADHTCDVCDKDMTDDSPHRPHCDVSRIDRCLTGREIGPPKPASEASE